jgi:D-inositol-3-phosphate glycosyltransferase
MWRLAGSKGRLIPAQAAFRPRFPLVNQIKLGELGSFSEGSDLSLNGTRISRALSQVKVALLTGGGDKPYALGLASALTACGVEVEFIGSDEHRTPELLNNPSVRFLNLRGDQSANASSGRKIIRVLFYYLRLLKYALTAKPRLFHLLWNNKFELFDRTLLMLFYRAVGRKLALTVHNVNARERDGNDSRRNRMSLGIQYRLADRLFVHTERMKRELQSSFSVAQRKVIVIPFGINNTVPNTSLSSMEAKQRLRVEAADKALLFFGNIAPYKGLEHLVSALIQLVRSDKSYRLIIAGRLKGADDYWRQIRHTIGESALTPFIIQRIEYIPDEETEIFFKAADLLVLPYTHVFQSGVLFLGYSFGLPALVTDVGSLKEEIIPGETGFIAAPSDAISLASAIRQYFDSELYRKLGQRRELIKTYANERYSWSRVAAITTGIYAELLETSGSWEGRQRSEEKIGSRSNRSLVS